MAASAAKSIRSSDEREWALSRGTLQLPIGTFFPHSGLRPPFIFEANRANRHLTVASRALRTAGRRGPVAGGGPSRRTERMSSTPRLLTAREASSYLGVSLNTLNRIEKRGLILPFRTPGGHRRYDVRMLDDYLEASRQPVRREAA